MSDFPFVSIIIVNYNGKQHLGGVLSSIDTLEYPKDKYNVYLVDNNSSDGSIEFVEKKYPWVKIIKSHKNIGYGGGVNLGLQNADGEYIAILNNDMEVNRRWLIELIQQAIQNTDAFFACKWINYFDREIIDSDGTFFSRFCYVGRNRTGEKDNQSTEVREIQFSAAILGKRELYIAVGNYPTDDPVGMFADVQYGLRARIYGYRIIYVPSSIIYHKRSTSTVETYFKRPTNVFTVERNSLLTFFRIYSLKSILLYLPLILLTRSLYLLFDLLRLRPKIFVYRLWAIFSIVKDFRQILKEREKIQLKRELPDDVFLKLSLETQLFSILRKRDFLGFLNKLFKIFKGATNI